MPDPAFRSVPAGAVVTEDSQLAFELATDLGMDLDADQRMLLDGIYAEREKGVPAALEVAVISPRQNIKTSTLEIAALTDLFVVREPLHVWTAHKADTGTKSFRHMWALIRSHDDYRSQCREALKGKGDQAIELLTGERIEFHARSTGAGRGLTAPKVTLDEGRYLNEAQVGDLLPTMAVIPGAQVRYASSAGTATSDVLRFVRNRGRAGGDPSLFYTEWCAPFVECTGERCMHAVDTPGCALDRLDLREMANPALRRRISVERMDFFRRSMPPAEFMREFLGWWEDPAEGADSALVAAWEKLADPGVIVGRPTFGVDVSPHGMSSAIAVAGAREDGLPQVELVERRPGTAGVVDVLVEKCKRHGAPVALDPSSEAGAMIIPLERAGVKVIQVGGREMAQACSAFDHTVTTAGLRHLGDPVIAAALAGAHQKDYGDGAWRWARRSSAADISPLVAVTVALHGHSAIQPVTPFAAYR